MDRGDGVNRFNLHNNEVLDHEIHAVSKFEFHFAIDDRKTHLGSRSKSGLYQFVLQAGGIRALQKSGAKFGMNSP